MSSGLSLAAVAELPVRWADHGGDLAAGRPVFEPALRFSRPCSETR